MRCKIETGRTRVIPLDDDIPHCHGRACPGHPRLELLQGREDVDARVKPAR